MKKHFLSVLLSASLLTSLFLNPIPVSAVTVSDGYSQEYTETDSSSCQTGQEIVCSYDQPLISAASSVPVRSIQFNCIQYGAYQMTLTQGFPYLLTVDVQPENATNKTLSWSSNNESVATVTSAGLVTGRNPGMATITVRANDGSGVSNSIVVKVNARLGITTQPTDVTASVGETFSFSVAATGSGLRYKWEYRYTNNEDDWTAWPGATSSTLTGTMTAEYNNRQVRCVVIDEQSQREESDTAYLRLRQSNSILVTGVTLNNSSISIKNHETYQLSATVLPSNATNKGLNWTTSNASVATVNSNGLVTAVGPGTATITATAKDGSGKKATCTVRVYNPIDFSQFVAPEGCVFQFRLYNPNSGEHFYTGSQVEAENLVRVGWNFEGSGFITPTVGPAIYRLYSAEHGDHFYTTSVAERDELLAEGWTLDGDTGIAFPSATAETGRPMYRLYNPNAYPNGEAGAHHFTMSWEEVQNLVAVGWQYEFVAWYSV